MRLIKSTLIIIIILFANLFACNDEEACNYNGIWNEDCLYPEDQGMCDCNGNYFDCNGECGGDDQSCIIMFQDGPMNFYANSDCDGELLYEAPGACICSLGPGGCSTIITEQACNDILGFWIDGNTCVEWIWDEDINETECLNLDGIWSEGGDCFFITLTGWDNIDECYCGSNGIYEEVYNYYSSEDTCIEGSLQSDNQWIDINEDNLLWNYVLNSRSTLYFYDDGTVYQTASIAECEVYPCLLGNYEINENSITLTTSDPNSPSDEFEGQLITDNDGNWLEFEVLIPNVFGADACFVVNFKSDLNLSNNSIINVDNYGLQTIYPNPFNPITTIHYKMPERANINIGVYDINGHLIENLHNGFKNSGNYSIVWNASNFSSGIYLIKMSSQSFIETKKVILIK